MVVMTLRPSSAAQSDCPPPRCATTTRRGVGTQLACPTDAPRVREPVEAVDTHGPAQARGERVRAGRLGDGAVERGVEAGDVGRSGPVRSRPTERIQRGRLMQRRELGETLELGDERVVDERGGGPGASVDDPVRDGVRRRSCERVVQGRRRFGTLTVPDLDDLDRCRSRVDREDPHPLKPPSAIPRPRGCPRRGPGSTHAPGPARRPSPGGAPHLRAPGPVRGRARPSRGGSGRGR